jgi:hypothetical protein
MGITTIQFDTATRDRLARFKSHPRETYVEVVKKFMALVPDSDDEGPYRDAFRIGLLNAKLDVLAGRLTPHEDVKRRFGL